MRLQIPLSILFLKLQRISHSLANNCSTWEIKHSFLYAFHYRIVIVTVEWRISTQHDVHDNSARPHIAFFIIVSIQHLRSYVIALNEFSKLVQQIIRERFTVPYSCFINFPFSNHREVPKSITFRFAFGSVESRRRFSGFRSLWKENQKFTFKRNFILWKIRYL